MSTLARAPLRQWPRRFRRSSTRARQGLPRSPAWKRRSCRLRELGTQSPRRPRKRTLRDADARLRRTSRAIDLIAARSLRSLRRTVPINGIHALAQLCADACFGDGAIVRVRLRELGCALAESSTSARAFSRSSPRRRRSCASSQRCVPTTRLAAISRASAADAIGICGSATFMPATR
jgi:hypothetical protein